MSRNTETFLDLAHSVLTVLYNRYCGLDAEVLSVLSLAGTVRYIQPSRLGKKYKDIKTKEWSVIMQNISTTANYKSSNIELCWERNDSQPFSNVASA